MYCAAGTQASTAATAGTTNAAVASQDGVLSATSTAPGWYLLVLAHLIVAAFSLAALSLALWKLRPASGSHRSWAGPPRRRARL